MGNLTLCLVLLTTAPALAQTNQGGRLGNQTKVETTRLSTPERVQKIRLEAETRRTQVRKDICERRQTQIQAIMPKLATSVTTLLAVMNRIYDRIQNFYASSKLTVSNYNELKAKVDEAKANAEDAAAAVTDFSFVLDCNNPSVGQQLDGYRSVIKEAKAALKEYRAALVNLIRALRAAAAEDNTSGQSQTDSNEETESP